MFTEERAGQAVTAAVSAAAAHGVRATDPEVLRNGSNLLVHLRPAPVVARVATATALIRADVGCWLARDLAIASYLLNAGIPAVSPSAELPARPAWQAGYRITFWTHTPHTDRYRPRRGEIATMLAELHAALRGYPGQLPGSPLSELPTAFELLSRSERLEADALAELRAEHRNAEAALRELGERQAVHGDAHPGNLLATSTGLRWNDFEDAWSGPCAWDLACLAQTSRMDGVAESAVLNEHFGYDRTGIGTRLANWRSARMAR